jgi:hypothetical protein
MNMEVTMPGTPVIEFVNIIGALVGVEGLPPGVSPVANPTMSPFGGFTAIPGMHTRAEDLANAINFNWHIMFGAGGPQITAAQAAQYLPGNPRGPVVPHGV